VFLCCIFWRESALVGIFLGNQVVELIEKNNIIILISGMSSSWGIP